MQAPTLPTSQLVLSWADLTVVEVGLACCAVEVLAAAATLDGVPEGAPAAPRAHVLVVAGTVTTAQAQTVRALYDALPEPRRVLSFGACANTGGPYWDSYAVVAGVDTLLPVDVYVPGCPPRPEALLDGLRVIERLIEDSTEDSIGDSIGARS